MRATPSRGAHKPCFRGYDGRRSGALKGQGPYPIPLPAAHDCRVVAEPRDGGLGGAAPQKNQPQSNECFGAGLVSVTARSSPVLAEALSRRAAAGCPSPGGQRPLKGSQIPRRHELNRRVGRGRFQRGARHSADCASFPIQPSLSLARELLPREPCPPEVPHCSSAVSTSPQHAVS